MRNRPTIFIRGTVDTHHSYLSVLLDLLGDSADVVLAVSGRLRENLDSRIRAYPGGIRVIELPSGAFLSPESSDALRAADGALFDEPFSLREMAGMLRFVLRNHPPFLLTIHNADSWFFPRLTASPSGLAASLLRRSIARLTGRCIVVSRNIRDYLRERGVSADILVVPFGFDPQGAHSVVSAEKKETAPSGDSGKRLRLVIPGMVSERRDYAAALDAFGRESLRETVTLVLLGKPSGAYGLRIMERVGELSERGFEIVRFDSFVPEDRFGEEMRAADVIFSPFPVRYVTVDGQVEWYGRTKETGVAPIALIAAKALLVPVEYAPPPEIATQVISYRTPDDLALILDRCAHEPAFLEPYARAARRNLAGFDLSEARKTLLMALGIGGGRW